MAEIVKSVALSLVNQDGEVVGSIDPKVMSMLPGFRAGGGGDSIGTLGDGVEVGVNIMEAIGIRDDVDDARDAMDRLFNARGAVYAYLSSIGSGTPIDGPKLAGLLRAEDVAQDRVDRAQNRAQSKAITVLWTNAFGGITRILGRMQSGIGNMAGYFGFGDGGDGDGGGLSLLAGAGIGALFGSMMNRDGGRRRRSRDEDSNVPPLP